jgi:hypothetical protein
MTCPNCFHALPQAPRASFCPHCGQATKLHAPSFFEFAHDFIHHYVAIDGALWRTLWVLLTKPGRLTTAYLQGQRQRFVLPLRLFLTASFLFFFVAKLLAPPPVDLAKVERAAEQAKAAKQVRSDAAAAAGPTAPAASAAAPSAATIPAASVALPGDVSLSATTDCDKSPDSCSALERRLVEQFKRIGKDRSAQRHAADRIAGAAPYAVLLMLPVFAGLMQLVYRQRRRAYGEHFVFALHLHALWFFAMLAIHVLPSAAMPWIALATLIHSLLAIEHRHAGRWAATLARSVLVMLAYAAVMAVAFLVVIFWAYRPL